MYKFYKSLNGGLQTKFGEKGIALSGEAHRIGIARSLYQNSQIIIFDEPTSALDSKSEKDVLNLINRLKKKIIIIISHRKSTEEICDKVIDLQLYDTVYDSKLVCLAVRDSKYLKTKYPKIGVITIQEIEILKYFVNYLNI